MTDKDMLERAARAAGIGQPDFIHEDGTWIYKEPRKPNWNPLTSDGDALRLAVNLGIDIQHFKGSQCVEAWHDSCDVCSEDYGEDPHAATRRAITRAAAAMAK